MSTRTIASFIAASVLLLGAQSALAGTDAVRAEAYFNAISGGNAETVTSFYADKAEFHWVGGPLAGVYKGKDQINGVWQRFSKAAGDIDYKALDLSESRNGRVSTVTARVNLIGPKEVPVKFILMFEDGKIVNEIWQVDKPAAIPHRRRRRSRSRCRRPPRSKRRRRSQLRRSRPSQRRPPRLRSRRRPLQGRRPRYKAQRRNT